MSLTQPWPMPRAGFSMSPTASSNDISVIDLARGVETKRLLAGRGAAYLELSADGQRIYCTHIYPQPGPFRSPNESEVTVIDTRRQMVVEREKLENAAGVFHVATANGGRVAIAAEIRPKNLIPLAHVEHGWVIGNSLAVFGADIGGVVQVPIDELDRYYTPPFGLAVTPGNRQLFVSTTGSDSVTAIDLPQAAGLHPRRRRRNSARLMANDLSASANYVSARIPVGRAPKGLALSPDGKRLYVANRNDDTISVIDTAAHRVTRTIGLGRAAAPTPERRGERPFFSARFAFQGHFGCANCHIEGTIDGLAVGSGAGRLRRGHRGEPAAGRYRGYGAVQMERQQSGSGNRVRTAHGEVLLPRPELFARRNWPTSSASSSRFRCAPTGTAARMAN